MAGPDRLWQLARPAATNMVMAITVPTDTGPLQSAQSSH